MTNKEKGTAISKRSLDKYAKNKTVLLEITGVSKTYGKDESMVKALSDFSLKIYKGELLVILGSSGSGKSTLLNLLGGMMLPDSGTIFFNGEDISHYNDRKLTEYRQNDIGFVFQSFNLIKELTALENVSLTSDMERNEIEDLFIKLKLAGKLDNYPHQLSGGEQQRVSIARALAKNPDLLLCDEPTGALDYESGKQILVLLEELVRKQKRTIVLVTHTREIGKMADRVVRMRNGMIIEEYINKKIETASTIEW